MADRTQTETHSRLQSMADELGLSLKELLELCERNGLQLVAQIGPPIKHPGHA